MADQQRRGRRAGGEGARGEILGAARAEFGERGYDAASIRAVARRAAVDPALVRYYFPDGKAQLFSATIADLGLNPADIAARIVTGGVEGLGARLVAAVLEIWDAPGGRERFRMIFAAAASTNQGQTIREFLSREVLSHVAHIMTGPDVPLRVNLAASQVAGLLVARHVLQFEPLASAPASQVIETVGRAVQTYFDDPSTPTN
ncbi:TetR family transcriptional regulator [Actinotalea subterranea]|uniref:TetR/AcrR family transcriptional regulator n=1 Tax=Actinotalea subterranea TaxID=2607497 RepID=UPI00165E61C9|nr:TetR family transcriptional regulator [Actinotalea subterranea]